MRNLILINKDGFGKRIEVSEDVAVLEVVGPDTKNVVVVTNSNPFNAYGITLPVTSIVKMGYHTKGVRIVKLKDGHSVVGLAKI